MVSPIKIQKNLCFSVAKNVEPVEDILEMHNVDNMLTEEERYNARIRCHHIAWDIKIRLENLNEANNGFTWIKCFTQVFYKMAKSGIKKIINGKTVQKSHTLFRVEEKSSFEKGEEATTIFPRNQLLYFQGNT